MNGLLLFQIKGKIINDFFSFPLQVLVAFFSHGPGPGPGPSPGPGPNLIPVLGPGPGPFIFLVPALVMVW